MVDLRENSQSLFRSLDGHKEQGWVRLNPGGGNSNWISYMGEGPDHLDHGHCLPNYTLAGSHNPEQNQGSNPGILIWDMIGVVVNCPPLLFLFLFSPGYSHVDVIGKNKGVGRKEAGRWKLGDGKEVAEEADEEGHGSLRGRERGEIQGKAIHESLGLAPAMTVAPLLCAVGMAAS